MINPTYAYKTASPINYTPEQQEYVHGKLSQSHMRFLGTSHNGTRKLYLNENDLYVYSYDLNDKCSGWFCSWPAWERTFYKILDDKDQKVLRCLICKWDISAEYLDGNGVCFFCDPADLK